ncbi:MAG: gliding motility-associated C-terminal domain-containing protein [Saprospiraceae bacterium]|nr:gliding motility-associated C-terminal domain-containing protein [Saprospiraceae bacterium]MDW8483852.1 gliding motility-associated C-terminal domain-containing protein [Saprospiraceae bacterium]
MNKFIPIAAALLFCGSFAGAQPSNDNCTNPIVISNVTNYCSAPAAFTNVGATPSGYGPATCFGTASNDVWFAFVAQATDVTIVVRGATQQAAGGTLRNPQVSLYAGLCGGTISQLACQSSTNNTHIAELSKSGLFVGTTYLIRVQGANNATGTFQLCLNNFNPPAVPTSDCPTAALLCDKSPFVVKSVTGAGSNITELNDAACFSGGAPTNYESNSTWFVWICDQPGTLTFTLTPLSPPDDLDFVVYRLPNGVGNCQGKQVVRCVASGDFSYPSPCMGPTGLRAGETRTSIPAGCNFSNPTTWAAPINMQSGEVYALCVNNFTSSGNGFSIEFGGTGTFLGPKADFALKPSAVCLGAPVEFTDASSFALGSITKYTWSFGPNAKPTVATGRGPHSVIFSEPGLHSVVLQIETNLGCKVTTIKTVQVYPQVEVDTFIAAPDCNGGTNGEIIITNIEKGTPPYLFSWRGGPFTSSNSLSGLAVGTYNVVIRDANNCETSLNIEVREKELTVVPEVRKPLCTGDANGVITLNVTNGTPPYLFNWGNGFVPSNTQGGFAAGVYTILGIDAELCKGTFKVTVTDNPPLSLQLDTTDISCYGANDGMGIVVASGGVGNYTYRWSQNSTNNVADRLGPGQYFVTVTDNNGCTIVGGIFISEPERISIRVVDKKDLRCNGLPEGAVTLSAEGGRKPYFYWVDSRRPTSSPRIENLPAGNYWIKMRDANGCVDSTFITLNQPPPLAIFANPKEITLDLGYTEQLRTTTSPPVGVKKFVWTPPLGLSCVDCPEPVLTAIRNALYIVQVTDENGCVAYDSVRLIVRDERPIYVPNVFAPDKPYPNNYFTLFGGPAALRIELLRIYDRWGSLVFEARDIPLNEPALGWDGRFRGKPVDGVFTFYALVRFADDRQSQYEGSVTVVR